MVKEMITIAMWRLLYRGDAPNFIILVSDTDKLIELK